MEGSAFIISIFSQPYSLITTPSFPQTKPFLTPYQLPLLTCYARSQLISILWKIRRSFLIALQQANKMILNNIINTIRTKQRKNANVWLYIPKKDVSIRLLWNLLFTFAKHGLLTVLSFPNLKHCVKSVQIRAEYRKIRTRNNSVL